MTNEMEEKMNREEEDLEMRNNLPYDLQDELTEMVMYNILSLLICRGELNKKYIKSKVIDSIIITNINFISTNLCMLSLGNVEKFLHIIDIILNNEGLYYKFRKVARFETTGNTNIVPYTKKAYTTDNTVTNLPPNGKKKTKRKYIEKVTREEIYKTNDKHFTDIPNLNNHICDIFVYIEEKNIYLSIFHLNYIFKNNEHYRKTFIKRYERYNSFEIFFTEFSKMYKKMDTDRTILYIKKKKYLHLYELLINSYKENFNFPIYTGKRSEKVPSHGAGDSGLESSSSLSEGTNIVEARHPVRRDVVGGSDVSHSGVGRSDVSHSGVGHSGVSHVGVGRSDVSHSGVDRSDVSHSGVGRSDVRHSGADRSDVRHSGVDRSVEERDKQTVLTPIRGSRKEGNFVYTNICRKNEEISAVGAEEYLPYNIINREKLKKLYKYKRKKYNLIVNNNFLSKKSYLPINIFPNNDLNISNVKFDNLEIGIHVKVHLLLLYTNIILHFNLFNSPLYLWVYKLVSFLLNIINNFNKKNYIYFDNSSMVSNINHENMFTLNKNKWDIKNTKKIKRIDTKKEHILKNILQKSAKEKNKINIHFPYSNYGYIETCDKTKKGGVNRLYFHRFVAAQILQYYAVLSLIEIENAHTGILACLLGDVYNRTVASICKFHRMENHYDLFLEKKKDNSRCTEGFKNDNVDLYLLISEMRKVRCANGNEDVVVNSLMHLYLFILFNYVNILTYFSMTDRDNTNDEFPCSDKKMSDKCNMYSHVHTYGNRLKEITKVEIDEKKDGEASLLTGQTYALVEEICTFAKDNNIRMELLEFRKSEYLVARVKRNYHFSGSLVTLPFYINRKDFYLIHPSDSLRRDKCDDFSTFRKMNLCNAIEKDGDNEGKSNLTIFENCISLIRERVQNILRHNVYLIFQFNHYLPFIINNFVDVLKKYNYFMYTCNSHHFAISLEYVYLLKSNINREALNGIYEKFLMIIKSDFYTDICKIIIIHIFVFFLKNKYFLNIIQNSLDNFYPSFFDSKDLAIVKYYFVENFVQKYKIPINLLDIYNNLCSHCNYEIIQGVHRNVPLSRRYSRASQKGGDPGNSGNCSDMYHRFCNHPHDNDAMKPVTARAIESRFSPKHKREQSDSMSGFTNFHTMKQDSSQQFLHNAGSEESHDMCMRYRKCRNIKSSLLLISKKEERYSNFGEKHLHNNTNELLYRKKRKKKLKHSCKFFLPNSYDSCDALYNLDRNDSHMVLEAATSICTPQDPPYGYLHDYNSEDDFLYLPSTGENMQVKKMYFLMFSYYIVRSYRQCSFLKKMLNVLVNHILLFHSNELSVVYFFLLYLHQKKEVQLFTFVEKSILKCLTKLLSPPYKTVNFLVFLFYLIKIEYANRKAIIKIVCSLLRKYTFPVKVYIIVFKIVKRILQYHDISNNYRYMLLILESIMLNNNGYLYSTSAFYMNIIENRIAFIEGDKLKVSESYQHNANIKNAVISSESSVFNHMNALPQVRNVAEGIPTEMKRIIGETKSGFLKLKLCRSDRKNTLHLYDKGCTIFYLQNGSRKVNQKIRNVHLDKYYNDNDFNTATFYNIYKENTYCWRNYRYYILHNEHPIYLPFFLRYTLAHAKGKRKREKKKKNCEKSAFVKTVPSESQFIRKKGTTKGNTNRKLFFLNICFVHKADFVNMHSVYIPYMELPSLNDDNVVNTNPCKGKEKGKNSLKGKGDKYLNRKELLILLNIIERRGKSFTLKRGKFYATTYSYMLHRAKGKNTLNCLIGSAKRNFDGKPTKVRNKQPLAKHSRKELTCTTHCNSFSHLKKDSTKNKTYKTICKLKRALWLLKRKHGTEWENRTKSSTQPVEKNAGRNDEMIRADRYKLLIKVVVKLLMSTSFYAYVVYLNKQKKTFKRFLGKYSLNFSDFFLPFKAYSQFWKFIFEDLWNGKNGIMYKSAKFMNLSSSHILKMINKKLHPFLVKENPNIKDVHIYNAPKYDMYVGKNYNLNDMYYAYNAHKKEKISDIIDDELYIDNYSLNSSYTNSDIGLNRINEKRVRKRRENRKKKKVYFFQFYKPKRLLQLPCASLVKPRKVEEEDRERITNMEKCQNITNEKENTIVNDTNYECVMKMYNKRNLSSFKRGGKGKYKFFMNADEGVLIKLKKGQSNQKGRTNQGEKKTKLPTILNLKRNFDGNAPGRNPCLKTTKKYGKIDIRKRGDHKNCPVATKFVGIFLPPKHHLLMVFRVYEESTIVQIRTDNLNVLNYLNPFFDECKNVALCPLAYVHICTEAY
ncbi:conserved Plasmodium protein, unknown function [Plasmodium ovale]|uniref:AP5B1 C-terminal domain-containing protein n=1 Tax=Plasmodium ovale TaxID=36330 RepID=A0A1C3L5B4_PLAOA|nr:conserved Plasmodium protein, unknown function [Plasmodium ovale]